MREKDGRRRTFLGLRDDPLEGGTCPAAPQLLGAWETRQGVLFLGLRLSPAGRLPISVSLAERISAEKPAPALRSHTRASLCAWTGSRSRGPCA
ncbi:Hypothetical protein NTJ_04822 [Nesidiocoris tenuis]|uniref:Uncharacterized protein n=1 Tax=Nesidiocoris tenuis TaxID=355587 RepID=A0ABN7AKR5_9HEMI|nr:Hypothetical protein NTJ_04822 [Nesidiocoris tenuis]